MKVYIDGEFFDEANAKVSVFDHGLLYGDGVFEGIRMYHNRIFKLREHVERLYWSAKAILLEIPMSPEEMTRACVETCRANQLREGYIRLIVTRGKGTLGLDPRRCPKPSVIIIASTIQLYPEKYYQEGLTIVTVPTTRNLPSAYSTSAAATSSASAASVRPSSTSASTLRSVTEPARIVPDEPPLPLPFAIR